MSEYNQATADAGSLVPSAGRQRQHVPGEAGIWVLIFGDIASFTAFFLVFMHYRGEALEVFRTSQALLDQRVGVLNTILLLTSSWFVATGVALARRGAVRKCARFLMLAFVCGVGFVVNKYFEYADKIGAGLLVTTNDFFMYYYMLTGIHLMHVLVGLIVLAWLSRSVSKAPIDARKISYLESGASFWHVVDLLWIALFTLLYLLP